MREENCDDDDWDDDWDDDDDDWDDDDVWEWMADRLDARQRFQRSTAICLKLLYMITIRWFDYNDDEHNYDDNNDDDDRDDDDNDDDDDNNC